MISQNITFLAFLYFVQGLPYGLQTWFLPVYFRSRGMSLSNVGFFKLLLTPWMCKALWAPFVDRSATKKSWLLWSMVGLTITCVSGSFSGPDFLSQLVAILFLFNLLASTQDIAVDGLAIQILSSSELAHGNIAQVVGYKIGAVVGGGLLTWLSDYLNWMMLFQCLAAVYVFAVFAAWKFIPSNPHHSHEVNQTVDSAISGEMSHETNTCDIDNEHSMQQRSVKVEKNEGKSVFLLIIDHFKLMMMPEGTVWIAVYVLMYKLGEKGSLSMIPLFLLDQGLATSVVGLWTGMMGQVVSISGSILGGVIMSRYGQSTLGLLKTLSIIRTIVLIVLCVLIYVWSSTYQAVFAAAVIALMLIMLLISGYITTATFTLMMECSQRAPVSVQASHYTSLATLEVLGKLTFSVITGWITDMTSYSSVFVLFTCLSAAIIPVFSYAPSILVQSTSHRRNKSR
ncbi:major facilitator superfamily domain-containing protein 3-like [Haliotis rubra]|uniref:major facilitator superfamily domain-containing protein 3-like n=1 Tax=Haliotis rubra TaxID=36100 RepID=UPI001EE56456|nr:major facilitator superfamily domain-containing protein 3-like [Haliotis rubra]XP_046545675.1 major facilitator superfamily domain-containing protein 3-like [Haliotis rubra]